MTPELILKISDLLNKKKNLATEETKVKDYYSFRARVFEEELKEEINVLETCLKNSPEQFPAFFKKCCEVREQENNGTAMSLSQISQSACNLLYWQLAEALFAPATLTEMLQILLPKTTYYVMPEVQYKNKKFELYLTEVPMSLFPHQNPDSTKLNELVIYDNKLFDLNDIAEFNFELHKLFFEKIKEQYPTLSSMIYQHNSDFKKLHEHMQICSEKGHTPFTIIKKLMTELQLSGSTITRENYASERGHRAFNDFMSWLNMLPEEFKNKLLACDSQNKQCSLERVVKHLTLGSCVEQASIDIEMILKNSDNLEILNSYPQISMDYLKSIEAEYKHSGGCKLYLRSELPEFSTQYNGSYIFINKNGNQELYFIKPDGKNEEVNIVDFKLFIKKIDSVIAEKKIDVSHNKNDIQLYLSKGQIEDIITSNGGHKCHKKLAVVLEPYNLLLSEKYTEVSMSKFTIKKRDDFIDLFLSLPSSCYSAFFKKAKISCVPKMPTPFARAIASGLFNENQVDAFKQAIKSNYNRLGSKLVLMEFLYNAKFYDALIWMLDKLTESERNNLMFGQKSSLMCFFSQLDEPFFTYFFDMFSEDEIVRIFKNIHKDHNLLQKSSPEICRRLMAKLPMEKRMNVLLPSEADKFCIYDICETSIYLTHNIAKFEAVMGDFSDKDRLKLAIDLFNCKINTNIELIFYRVLTPAVRFEWLLHTDAQNNMILMSLNKEYFGDILSRITEIDINKLFELNFDGMPFFSYIFDKSLLQYNQMLNLFNKIPREKRLDVLQKKDSNGSSSLHFLVRKNLNFLSTLISMLPLDTRKNALLNTNNDGSTVLHCYCMTLDLVVEILPMVNVEDFLDLLLFKDNKNDGFIKTYNSINPGKFINVNLMFSLKKILVSKDVVERLQKIEIILNDIPGDNNAKLLRKKVEFLGYIEPELLRLSEKNDQLSTNLKEALSELKEILVEDVNLNDSLRSWHSKYAILAEEITSKKRDFSFFNYDIHLNAQQIINKVGKRFEIFDHHHMNIDFDQSPTL